MAGISDDPTFKRNMGFGIFADPTPAMMTARKTFPAAPTPRTLAEALAMLEETRRVLADECRARAAAEQQVDALRARLDATPDVLSGRLADILQSVLAERDEARTRIAAALDALRTSVPSLAHANEYRLRRAYENAMTALTG